MLQSILLMYKAPFFLISGFCLAMLPIAFNSDNPGREIMGPMAAIIVGGLASSTVLNLMLLPAMLVKFGRFNEGHH